MLSTNKLRSIYSKIQTQLFYMIPEKWSKICLYASIMEQINHTEKGEMFFYYFPTGILKKNPINVYEIPSKFNIEEEEYMKLVNTLYKTIKELKLAFEESIEEEMWTNLTITIENSRFNVEYSYDDLIDSRYTSDERHIIWKYKYLNFPLERLSKKDRKMVETYLDNEKFENDNKKTYSEGMYKKKVHNIIEYNKEQIEFINTQNQDEKLETSQRTNNLTLDKKIRKDKYELYKTKMEENKKQLENCEKESKNQILSFKT